MDTNPAPLAYSYEIGCLHPNNSQIIRFIRVIRS